MWARTNHYKQPSPYAANSSVDFVAMTDTKKSDNKNEPVLLPQAGLKSKNRAKLLVPELKCVLGQTQIRRVFYPEDP